MKTFTSIILLSTTSSIVNGQIATRRGAKPTSSLSSSIVRTRVLRGNNNGSHLLQQSRRETKAEKKDTTGSAKAEKNDPSMKSNKMMKAKSAKSSSSKGGMVATSTNIYTLDGDFLTSAGDKVEFMSLSLQDDDMSMMNLDAMSIPEGSTPQDGDVVSQEDEEEAAAPIQDPLARGSANIKSSSISIGAVLVGTFIMLW